MEIMIQEADKVEPSSPVLLREFRPDDRALLRDWVRSEDELYLFAGGSLHWPLEEAEIVRVSSAPGVTPFSVVEVVSDTVCGHLEVVRVAPLQALTTHTTAAATVASAQKPTPPASDRARIARVIIAPAARGRGYSTPAILAVLTRLRDEGIREVSLHVIPGNEAALRSYTRAGFRTEPSLEHPEFVRMTTTLA